MDGGALESQRRRVTTEEDVSDVALTLPAEAESVGVARQVVCGVGDHLGLDDGRSADIALAVTEACTNVVMHAYPDGGGSYEVQFSMRNEHLTVTVLDEGEGISPKIGAKAGLGLGLPLMLTICDEVAFGRGVEGSTEVRMTFRLAEDGRGQA